MNKIIDAWGVFNDKSVLMDGYITLSDYTGRVWSEKALEGYTCKPIRILTDPNLIVIDPNDEAEMV